MGKPTRAMLMPTYAWNPYLRMLAAALTEQGLESSVVSEWPKRAPIVGAWRAQGRPGVVHLHWIHDFLGGSKGTPSRRNVYSFDWQLRVLKAAGVRIIWTVHNLKGHEAGTDANDRAAHQRLIEKADAIILHCDHARDALVEMYTPSAAARDRLHVLPHGNYTEHYAVDADAADARERMGLPAAGRVYAFVGAIRGYKNVSELLDAFSGVAELGPDDRLLVCGKPLPKRLGRELEERAVADPRIILRLDRIPEDELSMILRAADIAVLPFRNILTSGSAILALSHGRPVIAPAMGCLPETLPREATILYDPDSPRGLRDALRGAATADLASMGLRARAYADTLEWGPIAAATAALYRGE
jgi:glycosyltransferase involved in cell wall biosynthesis